MTAEQLTFLVERSGIPAVTLSALAGFALLLSPFPRFLLVLGAIRIGLRGFPASVLCFGFALLLAFYQTSPVLSRIGAKALELSPSGASFSPTASKEFLAFAETEWRGFLEPKIQPEMKVRVTNLVAPEQKDRAEWSVLALAFFLGELQQAMKISLILLLPLLVIDLLTGTILSALGVETLSADTVSFPLKVALILSVGGWTLIGENLLRSYG